MTHTYEKIASNKVKINFVFTAEEFDAALDTAFRKIRGRVNVPGFRKGKAPRKVIENYYGEGVLYDDAFDALVPDAYRKIVEEENIDVVDQPEMNIEEIGSGKEFKLICEVFVRPDVTLGDYKGLAVTAKKQVVKAADVDARIEQDRQKQAREVEVLDRPVAEGDTVNLDYSGSVDGVKFDGGTAEAQTLKIGSHQFIPGFEEQLVGMCNGEEKDINVTFPAEYHAADLAGKEAVFHVKVNSFTVSEMPELDDEFAADVSDFSTFAEYRADVEKQMEERAAKNNKVAGENAVIELAVDNAEVDIPEAMIKSEAEYMVREFEMQVMQYGMQLDEYLKMMGRTRDQLMDDYHDDAEKRVKMQLVIEAIRKAEGIELTDEDVEKAVADQASRLGREVEDFKKGLNDGQMAYIKDNALAIKTVETIAATAEITYEEADEAEAAEEDAE